MADIIHSEIGTHPADWSIRRVDSLFDIQQGKSVSKAHREGDNQKPFLRTKNVFWGKIDITKLDQMHFTNAEEARLKLRAGDLLLCEGGDVGRTAIVNDQMEGCYYQNHLHRLRAKAVNEIDPQFALYWFWYAFEIATIYIGRSNVTTIPNLSQSKLSELQIPKPKIDEQRRIAQVLATVQTAIEQQRRLIAATRELKRTLMRKLFTEGLRGEKQKDMEIGLVPESWDVLPLDELLIRTQYGLSVRGEDSGSYGILRMTNQFEGKISTDKMQFVNITQKDFDNYRLQRGDILFNRTNSLELVGRTAIFDNDGDYVFASYLIRLNTDKKRLNPFFLNHFMNWDESQNRLKSIALRAVSQSNISATRLRTFHVPVPPLEEQTEIIASIDTVAEKMKIHRRRKELLEELFRALLYQLMTGQMRVNEEADITGL